MKFYLPCKLGEEFTALKFAGWVDGERNYIEDQKMIFNGFDKAIFDMVCFARDSRGKTRLLNYGDYGKLYEARYELCIDDRYFEYGKLSDWGFPGNRTGKLMGLSIMEGYEVAHFCITPTYEHVYYAIKDFDYDTETPNIICYDSEKNDIIEQIKKEKQNKITHREELRLSEEEKNEVIRRAISKAKEIGIKLRKSDIDRNNLCVQRTFRGTLKYYCFVDVEKLGSRKRQVPRKLERDGISISNKKITFIFLNKC